MSEVVIIIQFLLFAIAGVALFITSKMKKKNNDSIADNKPIEEVKDELNKINKETKENEDEVNAADVNTINGGTELLRKFKESLQKLKDSKK